MNYISVAEAAKRWGLSERSVRNYCAQGRIPGALLTGKTWNVPEDAEKPARKTRSDAGRRDLLTVLREEKAAKLHGGIYHKIQIDLTYNSNHIEGSRLTHDQTRLIFETNTIGMDASVRVDDVVETANHFRCIDLILEEFWYGNIEPTEYDTSSCKEYKKLLELICRNEEKLRTTMTDEQNELFEKYTDCVREYQTITDCLIFQNSFKLGARIMLGVMEE